jgi:beta-lactamase regulating signal transducer with metallopeptidase domain
MTEVLFDHLWQSTWFVAAAAILIIAFRNNRAKVRFLIWLAASVKFLIPFSLLVLLGKHMHWETAFPVLHTSPQLALVLSQVGEPTSMVTAHFWKAPLASAATHPNWVAWTVILGVWCIGFLTVVGRGALQWARLLAVVKASTPLDIRAPIPVRETSTGLEPGVFGIISPVLLLPAGIADHLAPRQLDSILAHELCHWRRKDNLTAAVHVLVAALFWFHPVVWWLGSRMLIERERACDEAVIQSGADREIYAEGILRVCQLYLQPPLSYVAGVSGGTLRERIEEIMTNQVSGLRLAKKCLLSIAGFAAIAGPIAIGLATDPQATAHAQESAATRFNGVETIHYTNSQWSFRLDVPKSWNVFPPVSANSPFEVIRFMSVDEGTHNLIVFRNPRDPKASATSIADGAEQVLAKAGFSNFNTAEINIGSRQVVTLDFDKHMPDGAIWSCRQYFIVDGSLVYVLGFGTSNNRDAMFNLYDQMAKTFVIGEPAS